LVVNLQVARNNAQRSGTDQFKLEALQQVGSEAEGELAALVPGSRVSSMPFLRAAMR
jgi:hypothetical protein